MPPESRTIVAIDPGLISGIAIISVPYNLQGDATKLVSDEQPWVEAVSTVLSAVDEFQDSVLVVESFIITQATLRKSFEPWSLYSIGTLEYSLSVAGLQHVMTLQSPAMAKSLVSNDMLRVLGLWHRGGEGHANDALRHAVTFAIKRGWRPETLPKNL